MSDGELHRVQRDVISRPLKPKALAELQSGLQDLTDELVDALVYRGSFDAVTELAQPLPTSWVPDLLGWPEDARAHLLDWASASFDALGPANERCMAAVEGMAEMMQFARDVVASGDLAEGSMAAGVVQAVERGEITAEQCPAMLTAYLAPSLDTTISAIGNAIWLFATHPDQWAILRADPTKIKNAFNEAVRLESPISGFTRLTARAASLSGVEVPVGARVLAMYASANRDERRWGRADQFDVNREASAHLGFGHGVHACAGMGLARLEGNAILSALIRKVDYFEVGTPIRKLNNLIRSFAHLPVTVTATQTMASSASAAQ